MQISLTGIKSIAIRVLTFSPELDRVGKIVDGYEGEEDEEEGEGEEPSDADVTYRRVQDPRVELTPEDVARLVAMMQRQNDERFWSE